MLKALTRRMNRPAFPVYREMGGYRAWKDKKPPRQDSLMRLLVMGLVFAGILCLPCSAIGLYSNQQVAQRDMRRTAAVELSPVQSTPELTVEVTTEPTPQPTSTLLPTATLTPIPVRIVGESTPEATPELAANISTATLTPIPLRRTERPAPTSEMALTYTRLLTGTPIIPTARAFPTLPPAEPSTPRPLVITPAVEERANVGYPVEVVITVPPVYVVETVIVNQPPVIVVETVIVYPTAQPTATATSTPTSTPEQTVEVTAEFTPES